MQIAPGTSDAFPDFEPCDAPDQDDFNEIPGMFSSTCSIFDAIRSLRGASGSQVDSHASLVRIVAANPREDCNEMIDPVELITEESFDLLNDMFGQKLLKSE